MWATGPNGVHVFDPEGHLMGVIATGFPTTNLAFGHDQHVYITVDAMLLSIKVTEDLHF